MTALSTTALQGARTWFKTALSLNDSEIILGDGDGPRPSLPYLSVRELSDVDIGDPEDIGGIDGDDEATLKHRQPRRATLSVQGHGSDTHGWLIEARLKLRDPAVKAALETAYTSIIAGPVQNLSLVRDNAIEPRFGMDVEVAYAVETTPSEQTYADNVSVDVDLDDGDLTDTFNVDLS